MTYLPPLPVSRNYSNLILKYSWYILNVSSLQLCQEGHPTTKTQSNIPIDRQLMVTKQDFLEMEAEL